MKMNYNESKSSEVCPYCGEVLWAEWGYWSYEEMLLWDGLYYQWDMPCSHYRDIVPSEQQLDESKRRTQFVHMWAFMYPWTQEKSWNRDYYELDEQIVELMDE